MLKIYTQDWGWCGNILVIAASEEAARALMEGDHNYLQNESVEEHELVEGFMYGHDAS